MNEAERCDRISLMHAGKVLVSDTPAAMVGERAAGTLEDAFIAYLQDAIGGAAPPSAAPPAAAMPTPAQPSGQDAAARDRRRRCPNWRSSIFGACSPTRAARRSNCRAIRSAPRSPPSAA